eukprot:3405696-Pleurochrysis_carterae.AAC.1
MGVPQSDGGLPATVLPTCQRDRLELRENRRDHACIEWTGGECASARTAPEGFRFYTLQATRAKFVILCIFHRRPRPSPAVLQKL